MYLNACGIVCDAATSGRKAGCILRKGANAMNVIDITSELQTAKSKIRLAAYCRVSSDSADQLHSFASQIRYYKDYERKNPRYQLVDIYADEGITGTSMVKRDEFNRMIADCKAGKIDMILSSMTIRQILVPGRTSGMFSSKTDCICRTRHIRKWQRSWDRRSWNN